MPSSFRTELVDNVVKAIASYNPNRKLILIINESDYVVYISKDPMNIEKDGIPLYPYEGIIFDVSDADSPEEMLFSVSPEGIAKIRIYEALVA